MGGTEIELKLLLDEASLRKLRRLPWLRRLRTGAPAVRRLRSTYYDTPDWELRRRGITLRVRSIGRRHVQGAKTAAAPGVLTRREWEWPIERPAPDLARLPADLANELDGIDLRKLAPLFRTEVMRTVHRIGGEGWQAELAIDVGALMAEGKGEARIPIREVEIELADGPPERLYALGLELADLLPLRVGIASKSERGYALIAGETPQPRKWRPPVLDPQASTAEALRLIAGSCLEHFLANADCLRMTGEPEAVHQMRVAFRRLRSAIAVFRPYLAGEPTAAVEAEVKWLVDELGPARDMDVFLAEILAPVAGAMPDDEAIRALAGDYAALREQHYAKAGLALDSRRCTKLLLALGAWTGGGWRAAGDDRLGEVPSGDFAAAVLDRRDRKVRKAGHHLADLTAEERHRLRIQAKKLRYAGEFFASLCPEGKTRRFLAALARLQDGLGALNDVEVAARLLADAGGGDASRAWAAGTVAGWHACRRPRLLADSVKAWKAFEGLPRFWR